MKQKIILLLISGFLFSCQIQKPLYNWGKYEDKSYGYLKNTNDKTTKQLLEEYTKLIANQKLTRKVPPPGIFADYGFLLIQNGKSAEGRKFLEKEIAIYPESKIFIDRILLITKK